MRKILIAICVASAVMAMSCLLAASAHAWQVTIKNSCYGILYAEVIGHHLFWTQKECDLQIAEHETKTCVLPGLICPTFVGAYLYMPQYGKTSALPALDLNGGLVACWNHSVEAVKDGGGSCKWKQ